MSFYNFISTKNHLNGASDKLFWFLNFTKCNKGAIWYIVVLKRHNNYNKFRKSFYTLWESELYKSNLVIIFFIWYIQGEKSMAKLFKFFYVMIIILFSLFLVLAQIGYSKPSLSYFQISFFTLYKILYPILIIFVFLFLHYRL
jgi:hypothetical protein